MTTHHGHRPIHIPKTYAQLGITTIWQLPRGSSDAHPLPENTPLSFFLRWVLELVLRMLNHPPIRSLYALLIQHYYRGNGKPIGEDTAYNKVTQVLRLGMPTFVVSNEEPRSNSELAYTRRGRPEHEIIIVGWWLGFVRDRQPKDSEFDRALFFWTVVIMHEFAHYICLRAQWLPPKTYPGASKLMYTPLTVLPKGFAPFPKDGRMVGESGFWIEAQVFGIADTLSGSGRVVQENRPEGANIGHLWIFDANAREGGTCTRLSREGVKEFVRDPTRDIEEVWPIEVRNAVRGETFNWHPDYARG